MRLGTDIVDLGYCQEHHPRFIERILHSEEQQNFASLALSDPLLWMIWASKEAAYKAFKQGDRDLDFHPSIFIVDYQLTSVRYKDESIKLAVKHEDEMIFALACDREQTEIYTSIEKLPRAEDSQLERTRARAMTLELCARSLKLPESELSLSFEQRIPKLHHLGQGLAHCLSITHHGHWVSASIGISAKS